MAKQQNKTAAKLLAMYAKKYPHYKPHKLDLKKQAKEFGIDIKGKTDKQLKDEYAAKIDKSDFDLKAEAQAMGIKTAGKTDLRIQMECYDLSVTDKLDIKALATADKLEIDFKDKTYYELEREYYKKLNAKRREAKRKEIEAVEDPDPLNKMKKLNLR